MVRVIRIELIISIWKIEVIPFNYTRFITLIFFCISFLFLEHFHLANAIVKINVKTNLCVPQVNFCLFV
jgi:hypothetical protein